MSDKRIKAPLPGTFYRRPDPNAEVFVISADGVRESAAKRNSLRIRRKFR